MKKPLSPTIIVLLPLLLISCQSAGPGKPSPPDRQVKIIRHSDLPIVFDTKTRDRETRRFLVLINRYRMQKSLRPLSMDRTLQRAAQWMSDDMAAKSYLSHNDSRGRDPFKRLAAFGYNYNTNKGENVAAGQKTAEEALESWQSSKGHNRNMLDPQFTVIGIGFSYEKNSKYGWYWATSFGGLKSK
jgi:uncharacterized protein YkwD